MWLPTWDQVPCDHPLHILLAESRVPSSLPEFFLPGRCPTSCFLPQLWTTSFLLTGVASIQTQESPSINTMYFYFIWIVFAFVDNVCTACMLNALGDGKNKLDHLELELWLVVSCLMGVQVLRKSYRTLKNWVVSPAPSTCLWLHLHTVTSYCFTFSIDALIDLTWISPKTAIIGWYLSTQPNRSFKGECFHHLWSLLLYH